MRIIGQRLLSPWAPVVAGLFFGLACESTSRSVSPTVSGEPGASRSRDARLVQDAAEIPRIEGPDPTEPAGPAATTQPQHRYTPADLRKHVPTPEDIVEIARQMAGNLPTGLDQEFVTAVLQRAASIHRPRQVRLSLRDCIARALQNNYGVRAAGYGPAIEATRIVEAEARFDATFFMQLNSNRQDRPSSSQLQGNWSDTRTYGGGVRKLLATGTQIQASYGASRSASDLVFQTLNPAWFDQFTVEFNQPLLRGFGLDYNRAQIELYRLDRRISLEQFRRNLQETLYNVEQAYWQLHRARTDVVTSSILLADFERIDRFLEARKGFDTYPIQRGQVRSRLETRKTEFVALRAAVKTAEDAIKTLLNDPELTLAEDIEIIPTDYFDLEPVLLDRLGEVQAALDNRPELSEAQLTIEKARVAIGVAKNQALPKFDIIFRYIVDGLGDSWDSSFREMNENRFNEYYVGLEFEVPIGNRGPEAAVRRARLQESQAVASQAAQIEKIINEVHTAVRDVQTAYEQLNSSVLATQATQDEVQATRERQLARDPANLEVELNAIERLAGTRNNLTNVLVKYSVALSNLELKKGTLLRYNNIELRDPGEGRSAVAGIVPAAGAGGP